MARRLCDEDIWRHLDNLTKPPRSLGTLELLAHRLCGIQQSLEPRTAPRAVVVFAADHGVASAGVTAWPSDVTALMIANIRGGGAASSVLAELFDATIRVVDVGSQREEADAPDRRVRRGSRDLAKEAALSAEEFSMAMDIGRQEAVVCAEQGMAVVVVGEMGIGNTTPASCIAMLLAEVPLNDAVGRGAGADDQTLDRKRNVVGTAVRRARQWTDDPRTAIASVGGLEIGAMAGFFLAAHEHGLTILLDGFVATSAALVAHHFVASVPDSMIAAHLSTEPAHRQSLEKLGLKPMLQWDMRLGEGSGALLLLPLLDAAAAISTKMATFADAHIQRK